MCDPKIELLGKAIWSLCDAICQMNINTRSIVSAERARGLIEALEALDTSGPAFPPDLGAAINALCERFVAQEQALIEIAEATKSTARNLDSVTEGGNAMRTA